ncbi:radical SAM protein [bacterium]|nr:radical SAM protein [bacterium]MBU1984132.1 radical SAM protein [bacterium]
MLLAMQKGILYGPVNSRRYGKSLGVNLMPARDKLCPFNCVYCHYGVTRRCTLDMDLHVAEMPKLTNVVAAVEEAMLSPTHFDLVTFSGNGEPTMYPDFAPLVREIKRLRDELRPEAKIALLSNSAGAIWDDIQEVIPLIDLPIMKLDAGTPETFKAINRPTRGIELDDIMFSLSLLKDIRIQTVLVDGNPSNSSPSDLRAWMGRIAQLRPVEVHLYSIDRPVPNQSISLVPPDRLQEIAAQTTRDTGVKVKAFFAR